MGGGARGVVTHGGCRLYDVVHTDRNLTLVFEFLDKDLKKYLDGCEGGLEMNVVKVPCRARLCVVCVCCLCVLFVCVLFVLGVCLCCLCVLFVCVVCVFVCSCVRVFVCLFVCLFCERRRLRCRVAFVSARVGADAWARCCWRSPSCSSCSAASHTATTTACCTAT